MTRRNIPHGTPAGRHMLSLPCCFFIPLHFNIVSGHSSTSSTSISCSLTLPCWGVSLLYKTERRSNCDWCESRRRAFPSMMKTIIYERMREKQFYEAFSCCVSNWVQSRASHSAKRTDDCIKSVIDTERMQLFNLGDSCEGHMVGLTMRPWVGLQELSEVSTTWHEIARWKCSQSFIPWPDCVKSGLDIYQSRFRFQITRLKILLIALK